MGKQPGKAGDDLLTAHERQVQEEAIRSTGGWHGDGAPARTGPRGPKGVEETPVQRWKAYFLSKGLTPRDLPLAIVVHEGVGMSWLFGSWAACYFLRPSKKLGALAAGARVEQAIEAAERKVQAWSSSLARIPGMRSADRGRLAVSMAEASLVRNVMRPVTIPLKLWLAWTAVSMAKGQPASPLCSAYKA